MRFNIEKPAASADFPLSRSLPEETIRDNGVYRAIHMNQFYSNTNYCRYPPSAPLVEQPPTPPPSPDASEGTSSQIPIQDWSKLPPESAYFLGVNRGTSDTSWGNVAAPR